MGKVLILAAGEQARWESPLPKQIVPVLDGEPLIKRTLRQVHKRMNHYPHIVSHQKNLRPYSPNYIVPSARRYICETLLSVALIWGTDWTITLLGDVFYTDKTINLIYDQREKFRYQFYGTGSEIFAITFTANAQMEQACINTVKSAENGCSRGKLWELYYCLSGLPLEDSGRGRLWGDSLNDTTHYTIVDDGTRDFDTMEAYSQWMHEHQLNR